METTPILKNSHHFQAVFVKNASWLLNEDETEDPHLPPSPAGASGLIVGFHRCSSCGQPEGVPITLLTEEQHVPALALTHKVAPAVEARGS